MPIKKILQAIKNYQNANTSKRKGYLKKFEEKMAYRTTKTENPETTLKMVQETLAKIKRAR